MHDGIAKEIDDLRLDIATLRALIDAALDNDATGEDTLLQACSQVLRQRRERLEHLERVAASDAEQ